MAGVEPSVEVHIDNEAQQRFTHLGHGQRAPGAGGGDAHLPPRAHRLGRNGQALAAQPFLCAREGLDEGRFRAQDDGLRRQLAHGAGKRQVEDCAEDHAPCAVLRQDGGGLNGRRPAPDLLRLLEYGLEQLWTAEGCLASRLLESEHCRSQLVPEPGQQVSALLVGPPLTKLAAAPCQRQPASFRPPDQAAVQSQWCPWSAGWWKVEVGWTMPPVTWNRFHPPTHPDPHRTWRRWARPGGFYRQGRALESTLQWFTCR